MASSLCPPGRRLAVALQQGQHGELVADHAVLANLRVVEDRLVAGEDHWPRKLLAL
jgi:hypothetical protein